MRYRSTILRSTWDIVIVYLVYMYRPGIRELVDTAISLHARTYLPVKIEVSVYGTFLTYLCMSFDCG